MIVIFMVPGIVILWILGFLFHFGQNTLSSYPQNGGNFIVGVSLGIPQPLLHMYV